MKDIAIFGVGGVGREVLAPHGILLGSLMMDMRKA